ncbi:helix-turn-helix domain-containing protein [Actinomadura atramentaria]|uniref:helix-turn-helix domain-containing protein n=1 Tax=Actinomadura atramentaria TaxID=1990 RepID=UPI000364E7E6|nr:helix-turn-helix transcriptional regulator [Actinomadura atramentaria]
MPDSDGSVIARRLDHLFATVHPKDRRPYALREAARLINERAGEKLVSGAYLSQLRNGTRATPSHKILVAIAEFFGVSVEYFTDDAVAQRTDDQLDLVAALRDAEVKTIALRASGLSRESLRAILGMVENARRLEGLPESDVTKE